MLYALLAAFAPLVAAQAGGTLTYTVYKSTGELFQVPVSGVLSNVTGTGKSMGDCTAADGASLELVESGACKKAPATMIANNPVLGLIGDEIWYGAIQAPGDNPAAPYWLCGHPTEAGCTTLMSMAPNYGSSDLAAVGFAIDSAKNVVTDATAIGVCSPVASTDTCSINPASGTTYKASITALDDPCFPGSATVTKADGTLVRMDALKDGDAIVAAKADGSLTTDTVSMLLSVAKPETDAEFLTITTNGGRALNLTASHHLPVGPSCCSELKKAADVVVGDKLWIAAGAAGAVAKEVTKLSKAKGKGLHSPVLSHGTFPVVNGVVTSFDSIGKVTLASYGLGPALKACKATNTCGMLRYLLLGNK